MAYFSVDAPRRSQAPTHRADAPLFLFALRMLVAVALLAALMAALVMSAGRPTAAMAPGESFCDKVLAPVTGDNAPQIEAAMDSFSFRGGTICLDQGTYDVNTPINLDSSANNKVRLVGPGRKIDGAELRCSADPCFHAYTGSLQIVGPEFENIEVYRPSAMLHTGTAFKIEQIKHATFRGLWIEGFAIGVDFDSNIDSKGIYSDASYHVIDGGTRFLENKKGVVISEGEGGVEIFGGEFSCPNSNDCAHVEVRGWQTRIVGAKFEGNWNNGAGRSTGVRIFGNGVQMVGNQFESMGIGVELKAGADNNDLSHNLVSNGGDPMVGYKAESGATNNLFPSEKVGCLRQTPNCVVNADPSNMVVATAAAGS